MTVQETLSPLERRDTQQFDRITMAREGLSTRRAMAASAVGETALQSRVVEAMAADPRPNQLPVETIPSRLSLAITHMREANDALINGTTYLN